MCLGTFELSYTFLLSYFKIQRMYTDIGLLYAKLIVNYFLVFEFYSLSKLNVIRSRCTFYIYIYILIIFKKEKTI